MRNRSEADANRHLAQHAAPTITPTEHEKSNWMRMAKAAYDAGRNIIGNRYCASASLPHDTPMPLQRFDSLQRGYCAWLNWNEWE